MRSSIKLDTKYSNSKRSKVTIIIIKSRGRVGKGTTFAQLADADLFVATVAERSVSASCSSQFKFL